MDKHTKILIPEIPGEWTQRARHGHTNIWNGADYHRFCRTTTDLAEVSLEPPERGLFAERIDGAWYWVCGCEQCLDNGKQHSYITCYEHDRCTDCRVHSSELPKGITRWGIGPGFRCSTCQDALNAITRADALAKAAENGHDELDCAFTDNILCPHCASEQTDDDRHMDEDAAQCDVCSGLYSLEVIHSVSYTTRCK